MLTGKRTKTASPKIPICKSFKSMHRYIESLYIRFLDVTMHVVKEFKLLINYTPMEIVLGFGQGWWNSRIFVVHSNFSITTQQKIWYWLQGPTTKREQRSVRKDRKKKGKRREEDTGQRETKQAIKWRTKEWNYRWKGETQPKDCRKNKKMKIKSKKKQERQLAHQRNKERNHRWKEETPQKYCIKYRAKVRKRMLEQPRTCQTFPLPV